MGPMKLALITALSLAPLTTWAQINAAADLEVPNPPIRAQSVLNGQMFGSETEFLTPEGIIDTLPPRQQAYVPLEEIAPAAGPETFSIEVGDEHGYDTPAQPIVAESTENSDDYTDTLEAETAPAPAIFHEFSQPTAETEINPL